MTSIIKKIKRKRKAQTWERSTFSRKARLLRRMQMVMVAEQGLAQMRAISSAQALGLEGMIQKNLAYVNAAEATMKSVSAVSRQKLYGSKTT